MSIGYSPAMNAIRLQLIATAIDSGGDNGYLTFYPGTRPPSAGDATAQTAILKMNFFYPSRGSAGDTQMMLRTEVPVQIAVSGEPKWARISNSAGVALMDLDVGLDGSGADLIISAARWFEGGEVTTDSIILVI